jgi:serine/threonine protein kinase
MPLTGFETKSESQGRYRIRMCAAFMMWGELEGQLFLSMEYVDGEDLASLLRRIGRLPETRPGDCAQAVRRFGGGTDKGVLHRDLKPPTSCLTPGVKSC